MDESPYKAPGGARAPVLTVAGEIAWAVVLFLVVIAAAGSFGFFGVPKR